MPRISRWRLFFTVLAVAGGVYALMNIPVQLGLDLRGGTQIVLEAQDTDQVEVDAEVTARTLEVLRRRVDAFGVSEPTLQVSGDDRIIVELPGVTDPDEALEVIGRTAQLTFHPVLESYAPEQAPEEVENGQLLPGELGEVIHVAPVAVSGEEVEAAGAVFDGQGTGGWVVSIDFRGAGGQRWAELTGEAACAPPGSPQRRVAIVLDNQVISSPGVTPDVGCGVGITGGSTIITGNFDQAEAEELALLIRAGALPVPVEVIEQGTIGPTLGETAIEASIQAALIGATLTILYMIAFYRLMGVVAAISLGVYGLLSFGALSGIGATLTLPGIAGFVLAIGMAVDANVLVYERAKEESREGTSVGESLVAGFERAWSAIIDANVTTLLAAMLLFFFASGGVQGFGVTLSIGVVVSMFSALVVTRVLLEILTRSAALNRRPKLMGLTFGQRFHDWLRERQPDLLGDWKRWMFISAGVVVLALVGIFGRGVQLGLEFEGGRLVEYQTSQEVEPEAVRSQLAEVGVPRALVQESGQGTIVIRTSELDEDQETGLENTLSEMGGELTLIRDQFVGPTLGEELRNQALMALGLALLFQLGYLAFRFRWTVGLGSMAALFHDVAILVGIFAWMGKTFDGVFLAALLTVIGYSVNDSVVIFDRVREKFAGNPDSPLPRLTNEACLQTLPRTINTGMGALLILIALYLLGGDTLSDFALALLIGTVVGSYSSIFTASPVMLALEQRYPRPFPEPEKPSERRTRERQRAREANRLQR